MQDITVKKHNGVFIKYEIIDAKTIRVLFNKTPEYENNVIQLDGWKVTEKEYIKITIYGTTVNFYCENITKQNNRTFLINSHKPTKTTVFLLPSLGKDALYFSKHNFLINAYLNRNLTQLICQYRIYPTEYFEKLERRLKSHPLFLDIKTEKDFLYASFMCTELNVLDLFMKGKYSKFPDKYKQTILKFHNYSSKGTTAEILYKSKKRKKQLELDLNVPYISTDQELFSKPDINHETIEWHE